MAGTRGSLGTKSKKNPIKQIAHTKKKNLLFHLLSKMIQHSISLSEKICESLHSVTGGTHWSSNNFNQMFPVTLDQSCTSAWRTFGPFLLTELLQLGDICGLSCMNCSLQVLPQHFNWVKVWTLTWPFQNAKSLFLLEIYLCV